MRTVNGKGEEKSGGVYATLSEEIQSMLDNCAAVKGQQFMRLVSAQHALMQMPTVLQATYLAGIQKDTAGVMGLLETHAALTLAIVAALYGGSSEAEMEEAFNLASGFVQRQKALVDSQPK